MERPHKRKAELLKDVNPVSPSSRPVDQSRISKKSEIDVNKSLECLVCGKKFSRGIVDLTRHQTAITLKHYFSQNKTSVCTLECIQCGTFFSSSEHLILHRSQSSCAKSNEVPPTGNTSVLNPSASSPLVSEIALVRASRKGKVLIPSERKAYFAVLSVLAKLANTTADRQHLSLDAGDSRIDVVEIIQALPDESKRLLERLREFLLYDC